MMAEPFSIKSGTVKNLSPPQVHAEHFPVWYVRGDQKAKGKKWRAQEGRHYNIFDIFVIRQMFLPNMRLGIGKKIQNKGKLCFNQ